MRESQFPHRPTELRRGSLFPEPSKRTQRTARRRSKKAPSALAVIGRGLRALLIVGVLGFIAWQWLSDVDSVELQRMQRAIEGIFNEIRGQLERRTTATPQEPKRTVANQVEPEQAPWRRHLERAIQLSKSRGNDEQAEAEFMNALFAAESFGKSDERLTNVLDHFGYFYDQRERYGEALEHYLRALEGYRRSVGESHQHFIGLARRIGYVYRAQSRYAEALDYLGLAVAGAAELHGPEYAGVAYGYREIGDLKVWLNDSEGARAAYERALKVSSGTLGNDHALTLELKAALRQL